MLEEIISWILFTFFKLNPELKWVDSLNFFINDSIKIILLLFIMILVIGFLRTYFPQEKIKKWISKIRTITNCICVGFCFR